MIEPDHPRLSIVRQCALVRIARSSHYYTGGGESALNLQLMRLIDEQYFVDPLVRGATDGASSQATGLHGGSQKDPSTDAADGPDGHLPEAEYVAASP